MKKKSVRYAFWKYASYPYILGGTITKEHPNGLVETKEYGQGNKFRPVAIVSAEYGKPISEILKYLEYTYNQEKDALHDEWKRRVEKLVSDKLGVDLK